MLKKIMAIVSRLLEKQSNKHAELLHSGGSVRISDEVLVDYTDTRMVGQHPVTPRFIRPFGMKEDKF